MSEMKPYPEYKDSDVEWLGKIPRHWEIARIKNSVKSAKNGVWGDDPTGGDDDIRCVRVADFNRQQMTIHDDAVTLRSVPSKDRVGRVLQTGDLLLEKSGGGPNTPVGFVVLYDRDEPAVCSNFVARVELRAGQDSSYWKYLHSTTYASGLTQRSIKQATGIQNLDQSSYFDEAAPFPPCSEQRAIAAYLDRETAAIDAFIADQEELIERLIERRIVTITRAVTKGLDPSAQMKDSGIAWIGKMPHLWGLQRLSWLFNTISSGTTPPSEDQKYYGGDINWVTTGELRESIITDTAKKVTHEAVSELSALRVYEPGTLLIAMYGATIGRLGVLGAPATTNQACCAMADPKGVSVAFMSYVLLAAREHLLVLASGGGQPNINQDKLRSLRIATPTLTEQEAIASYLDYETSEIDAAIADAMKAIELSKERRAALISAAVTGKIDVRNHITGELGAA